MTFGIVLLGWNAAVAAVLAVSVWACCRTRFFSSRPALGHALWLLVLLKLVTPPLVPLPLLATAEMPAIPPEEAAFLPGTLSGNSASLEFAPETAVVVGEAVAAAPDALPRDVSAIKPPVAEQSAARSAGGLLGAQAIPLALLALSLAVTGALWWITLRNSRRIGRLIRGVTLSDARGGAILDELIPKFGIRPRPALLVVDQAITPLLWAVPRQTAIVLPRRIVEACDEDQLRGILAHELAHLARRDVWTQGMAFLVTSLLWWNPCAWWARRELRAAAEACCDARVLEQYPGLRKAYARGLLMAIDLAAGQRSLQVVSALTFGEASSLKRRITMIAGKSAKPRVSKPGWMLWFCVALVLLAYPTRAQDPPAPPGDAKSANAAKTPVEGAGEKPAFPQDVKDDEIAGVVVDSQGRPLAGVLVDAWTWYKGDETKTDERGVFRLTPGDRDTAYVEVRFSKPGYSPHYIVQQPRGAKEFLVTLGDKTLIQGAVRDASGKPVAKAKITGVQGGKQADGVFINRVTTESMTDEQGQYRMPVYPDTYELEVVVAGVGTARILGVNVSLNEAKSVDIDLKPGVRFEARVFDANTQAPVEKVVLYNWRDKSVLGISDSEGKLVIEGMLPGKYEFSVGQGEPKRRNQYTYYEHGELGRWWSPDAIHPWEQKMLDGDGNGWQRNLDGLTFELSAGMKPVTIEVERGVTFSGHVYDPDGKPVAGATVAPAKTGSGNSLTGDTRYSVKTGKDGSYRAVMPAGNTFSYNLVAHDGVYAQWRHWANGVSEPLTTKPGEQFDNYDLKLTRGATVRGRVVSKGNRVIGKREVRAHAADLRENRYYDPTTKVRADGSFELKFIRPGKQFIQVSPHYLTAAEAPEGTSVLVDLKEGEVLEGIELQVAPTAEPTSPALAARTFRVTVVDQHGKPLAKQPLAIATPQNPINLKSLMGDRKQLAERVLGTAIGGQQFTTSDKGVIEIPGGQLFTRHRSSALVVAINGELGQAALGTLFADLEVPEITLQVAPLCEVSLDVVTDDLRGSVEPATAYLVGRSDVLLHGQVTDGRFVASLPAGDYKLSFTHPLANMESIDLTVKADVAHQTLDPVRLTPSRLATLIGAPAPALREIIEWRNGEPVQLSDLQGRIVILDFWGYWCGPCLASMPNLMKIHDRYPAEQVIIIAVHDGTLSSLADLEKRVEHAKAHLWGGRDLPFRIALAGGGAAKIEGTEMQANGQAVADYGITSFPTTLLIDQRGNVVTRLNHGDLQQATKQIDRLLGK